MAKRKKNNGASEKQGKDLLSVADYRHDSATRKNNPPAKIAAEGTVPVLPKIEYSYSPRRPPTLQFDPAAGPDALPELLAESTRRPLTTDEARTQAEALRTQEPWLEWAGKREQQADGFAVDPVALLIHERISAQAVLRIAARQDVQRDLFADPQQAYHEAVQFYRHNVDWSNRLILGDSLHVMASLARREDLAGKVQMIYIDPPYGIKFPSNFQALVGNRDVKDKESDLTREPEMVKAYRDTWHLGVHSYLAYLRDRLVVSRELLADTGSIFVQISDQNLHRVRMLMDDVFGAENAVTLVVVRKTAAVSSPEARVNVLATTCDYLLWYAKDKDRIKYRQLFELKAAGYSGSATYCWLKSNGGVIRRMSPEEMASPALVPDGHTIFKMDNLTSPGWSEALSSAVPFQGQDFTLRGNLHWKTTPSGLRRLIAAERIRQSGVALMYVRVFDDFAIYPATDIWLDTGTGSFTDQKVYSVQTATKAIARCLLMTTDPGDLVLDPTCGSGTTAYVAEQWGRRWITIDTSRVAIAIARQRLLTAKFDRYRVKGEDEQGNGNGQHRPGVDPHSGFVYKTVAHITLKSIAQNANLDPIFARHEPILDQNLAACNAALRQVNAELRQKLQLKLIDKQRAEGKPAVTDADRRRWELPDRAKKWEHWQVPFDTDNDWPKDLQRAVADYRQAWRAKMDEVNACIAANAEPEELVDQPQVVKGVVRVSGPFSVESVQPPALSLGDEIIVRTAEGGLIGGEPEPLEETFLSIRRVEPRSDFEVKNVLAYLDQMIRLLRMDGVRFPNNRQNNFSRLEALSGNDGGLHAEGRWAPAGETDPDPEGRATVAVGFGPQYGPVTAKQVEELVRATSRRGYDDLVVAGFSFDGPAQAVIEEAQHPKLRIHMAHIRPDVNPAMAGLLKEQPGSQLFSVFGQPRTRVEGPDKQGEYRVVMEGVDIYDPVTNSIQSTEDQKVAAWFLDSDYDGRTFCITQAFFPDRSAWDKLAKALNGKDGVIEESAFEALSGTESLPFPAGEHKCVAVKVIDPRGNEVMRVEKLK